MLIRVDSRGNKYLSWAKAQLQSLTQLRKELNLPMLKKHFIPETGFFVRIVSSEWRDSIYIKAEASSQGRTWLSNMNEDTFVPVPRRYYLLEKGSLKQYSEVMNGPNVSPPLRADWSLDGKTLMWIPNVGESPAYISRQLRVPFVVPKGSGVSGSPPGLPLTNFSYYYSEAAGTIPDPGIQGFNYHSACSEDGHFVTVVKDYFEPFTYRISDAQLLDEEQPRDLWIGPTDFALQASGYPPQIDAFYASRSIPQTIRRTNTAAYGNLTIDLGASGDLLYNATAGSTFAGPYYWQVSSVNNAGFIARVRYDRFNDCPVALFTVPWISNSDIVVNPGSPTFREIELTISVRWWLFKYNYETTLWEEVWVRDVDDAFAENWTEIGAPSFPFSLDYGTFNGFPVRGNAFGGARYSLPNSDAVEVNFEVGYLMSTVPYLVSATDGLGVLYMQPNRIRAEPFRSTNPASAGHIFAPGGITYTAGPNTLWRNGVMLTDELPILVETLGPVEEASILGLAYIQIWAYAEHGFLINYKAFDDPAVIDPIGLYWFHRPDSDSDFTRTYLGVFIDGSIERRNHVWLSPDGKKLWLTGGNTFVYYEDGVAPITFFNTIVDTPVPPTVIPDNVAYVTAVHGWSYDRNIARVTASSFEGMTTGPSPTPIFSSPAVMLVTYDSVMGIVKIVETLSTVEVSVPSKGPIAEDVFDAKDPKLSDAELIQDEFIQHS